jgi:hypothetical protein
MTGSQHKIRENGPVRTRLALRLRTRPASTEKFKQHMILKNKFQKDTIVFFKINLYTVRHCDRRSEPRQGWHVAGPEFFAKKKIAARSDH